MKKGVAKFLYNFSDDQWSWIEQNMERLNIPERMAARAGMFFAKSWQLDPAYPSVFNTPDREIIPRGDGLYKCWFPGEGWLTLRPASGIVDMLKDVWNILPNIAAEFVFTIIGITDFQYENGKMVAYSNKIKSFGASSGNFIVINPEIADKYTYTHEYGHTILNDIFGPFNTFGLAQTLCGLTNYVFHIWKNPYCKPGSSNMSAWEYYFYWSNPFEMYAMQYSGFFDQFRKK